MVLDNAEALLGEAAAGVGVGAGGPGASGSNWGGPDLLARLAKLPDMVASFSGFGGASRGVSAIFPNAYSTFV